MNIRVILVSVMATVMLFSCAENSSESAESKKEEAVSVLDRLNEIEEIRTSVKKATNDKFAKAEAERLRGFLIAYVDEFPNDTITPELLFEAGNICIGLKDFEKSILYFDRLANHYPQYIKRPEVLYMTAFVYDYHMNQYGKAKERYEVVIEEYPTHVFAGEAKNAIEVLGLSDAELIERFKNQNK